MLNRLARRAIMIGCLLAAGPLEAALPVRPLFELTLEGRRIEGTPLHWNESLVRLLGRDGHLWEFPPSAAKDFRRAPDPFRPLAISELRAALLRELGPGFEVSGTGHYVAAHAAGQRDVWAQRFEDLYRAFVHYCGVRGLPLVEPAFPLVAIVCRNQAEFRQFAARNGAQVSRGVLGYYEPGSNRIVLYDMGGRSDPRQWQHNASALIHEATHQTAFNTGIHSRYTVTPVWVAEGLATMFEAPGVYASRHYTTQADRINQQRFVQFRELIAGHRHEMLAALIADDQMFRASPAAAYAESWALTFFLMETQPRQYGEYLARTARRPPFSEYPAAQRTADFQTVFGSDLRMLESRLLRFISGLPVPPQ